VFNFVSFMPRRAHVIVAIKLLQSQETDAALSDVGLERLAYDSQWRQYRVRIDEDPDAKQSDVLVAMFQKAREGFGKSG